MYTLRSRIGGSWRSVQIELLVVFFFAFRESYAHFAKFSDIPGAKQNIPY